MHEILRIVSGSYRPRVLHAGPYNQYGLLAGVYVQTGEQVRAISGLDGVGFGLGPGLRTDVGSPTPPSQLQHGPGRILMPIPVAAGARTLSVSTRFYPDSGAGKRPRLVVKRDLAIGVQNDVVVEAGAGGGLSFGTITLAVTLAVDGVLECYREQQDVRMDAWTLWDNLVVT